MASIEDEIVAVLSQSQPHGFAYIARHADGGASTDEQKEAIERMVRAGRLIETRRRQITYMRTFLLPKEDSRR